MSKKRYLVTAGLPYSNGRLHVGHIAGAYLPADIFVRYLRLRGEEVRYVCGSDDNGVASLISSRKEGKTVEELTQYYNHRQFEDFKGLGISFDVYGGTHQPHYLAMHERISQDFFKTIHDKGFFVKKASQQLYDEQAQQFLPDRYVKGVCHHCAHPEAYGDQCESCGQTIEPLKLVNPISTITGTRPVPKETVHWYFQLERFQAQLKQWLESKRQPVEDDPAPIWRDMVLNFSLGQINQGLPERAITRDMSWGIAVPLDDPDAKGKVIYVWFDAPIGYVSITAQMCADQEGDWQRYTKWWKDPDTRIIHFVGEDNTVFHALMWPAMLLAEGSYQLPWQVVVNSFLNIKFPGQEEQKISKSRGMAIWIEEYLKNFEPDPLRFYLTAIAPETHRTTFDIDDFITRNNNELLSTLGNFINRALTFSSRHFENTVPDVGQRTDIDLKHLANIQTTMETVSRHIDNFRFKAAQGEIMSLAKASNIYFDAKQPWRQVKESLAACGTTINVSLQTIKAFMIMMAPFLPFSAQKCAAMLKLDWEKLTWDDARTELPAGHLLGVQEMLFKKLDPSTLFNAPDAPAIPALESEKTPASPPVAEKAKVADQKPVVDATTKISYDDFAKLDLRVAKVLAAEKVAGADKLLKLQIEIGPEQRQIVAGIAKHYTPEEMVGKHIVVVANLQPAKIRGQESNGMLLAASSDDGFALLTPERPVPDGSKVK